MGYATREIHLAKRKKQGDLRVTLREDSQQLKEVVVTAMGIKKDTKRLGYAVSTIESDEIVKAGATNFASAMYGKAPGIRITQTQGGSAGAVSINVRGLTSITGNNQPLIILDGVPIRNGGTGKSTDFAEFGNDGQIRSNGLVDINPEDIESVSVLKGASATALYGSEAANGAVVITSKRAKSGKLTVDFTAQVTANLPAYLPKVQTVYGPGRYNTEYSDYEKQTGGFYQRTMNGESYRSLYNTTMSFGPKYDGSDVLYWDGKMRPYLPATDNPWKELFRTGWNQTYNLAISQGTETSSNRFSYTFMGETPNSLTGSFTKHNFKLTGSYKPARTLNIEYSLNYIVQDVKDRPQTSLNLYGSFSNMFSSFMDIPYLKQSYVTSLGYRNTYAGGDATLTPDEAWAYDPGYLNGVSNMLWNMYHHHSKETENRLIGMIRPTWQITNWLSLRAQLSTDITDTKQTLEYETERPNSLYDPSGSIQNIRKPVGPPLDAVGFQRRQPPGLTENIVLCAGDDGQDDFRTACADAAAADGDAGHDNYLTEKRYFHHTACPAACQACRSKNRKQVVFCGNLHLRDGRKSFTISAAKAVWPAWGCAAFFVLAGKESIGNENDCAGAGGLSGS